MTVLDFESVNARRIRVGGDFPLNQIGSRDVRPFTLLAIGCVMTLLCLVFFSHFQVICF